MTPSTTTWASLLRPRGRTRNDRGVPTVEFLKLWRDACAGRWGAGSGYRDDVASWIRNWCENSEQQPVHSGVEKRVHQSWVDCFLKPLAALCDASELFSDGAK